MNKRLLKLIENQPIRGGQFLDCYNQSVSDIAGTITTRVDAANMIFVTEYETDNDFGQFASTRKHPNN